MDYFKQLDKLTKELQKEYPNGTIMNFRTGDKMVEIERVPVSNPLIGKLFGGGGCPIGRTIEIYGPESSGKSSLVEYIAGQYQKYDFPNIDQKTGEVETSKDGEILTHKGTVLYVDTENAIDPVFAKKHGLNMDDVILVQPDSGEDGLDVALAYIESGLVDLVVLDSIAMTTPRAEIEGEMGDMQVGAQARMFSKFFRKATALINKTKCTLLCVNQIRMKIGVLYGNPETTSGGNAVKFSTSIRIEVRRKEFITDKDEVIGIVIAAKTVKNKTAAPGVKCLLNMSYETSFEPTTEWIDIAIENGLIEMAGAGWAIIKTASGEEMKIQGKPKIQEYYEQHKDEYDILISKCKSVLYNGSGSRVPLDVSEDELEEN